MEASDYSDGYYTYSLSGDGVVITDVSTAISGDVTIPSTLSFEVEDDWVTAPVVAIEQSASGFCCGLYCAL